LGYLLPFTIRWSPELKEQFEALLAKYELSPSYGLYAHGMKGKMDIVAIHDIGPDQGFYINRTYDQRQELLHDLVELFQKAAQE
jgi:hypothetical protein